MIRLIFLSALIGCEQIEPTGDPLKPVTVEQAPVVDVGNEALSDDEKATDEEEPFSISSEELAAIADGTDDAATSARLGEAPSKNTAQDEPPAEALPEQPVTDAPPPPPAAPPPPTTHASSWAKAMDKAWPVRLVTTIPNASPPRAILGLPNGKEVVVNPGSMVPDLGLVVVAISPGSAELAKIAPAGDHATIESVTLRAQY